MKPIRLQIKPLSVNEVWQGKRYKTPKYKRYEKAVILMLPTIQIPNEKLKIEINYGFSSKLSDVDNPTKPLLDILQKKYKFNDNQIYQLNLSKKIVNKGMEYIDICISKLDF
jgi:Holliday junction resolvase RusA-like endonuclease